MVVFELRQLLESVDIGQGNGREISEPVSVAEMIMVWLTLVVDASGADMRASSSK